MLRRRSAASGRHRIEHSFPPEPVSEPVTGLPGPTGAGASVGRSASLGRPSQAPRKGRTVYAVIRRYQIDPQAAGLVSRRVTEDLRPLLRRGVRFVAYYAVDAGDGVLVSVSVDEDRAVAEASSRLAAEWVARKLGPLLLPHALESTVGEVVAHGGHPVSAPTEPSRCRQEPVEAHGRWWYCVDLVAL